MIGEFTDYYGFSREELEEQILKKIFKNKEDYKEILELLKYWYNGYNIGRKKYLFNAYSVMCCLDNLSKNNENAFKAYWSNSTTASILSEFANSKNFSKEFKS